MPIITGGTGLYFKALEQGLADIPPIPTEITEKWRAAKGDLHAELAGATKAWPRGSIPMTGSASSGRWRCWREPADRSITGSGRRKSRRCSRTLRSSGIFVNPDREELYSRAEDRFDQMVKGGGLEEVKALLALARQRQAYHEGDRGPGDRGLLSGWRGYEEAIEAGQNRDPAIHQAAVDLVAEPDAGLAGETRLTFSPTPN